jgi:hypothetical protein
MNADLRVVVGEVDADFTSRSSLSPDRARLRWFQKFVLETTAENGRSSGFDLNVILEVRAPYTC